ncbi:MAG: lipocalin family protein, partial [Lysobacter sp.]
MKTFLCCAVLLAAALLSACTSPHPPLPTVRSVDLDRYTGTWYEIARLPNRFQSMCGSDTRAVYRAEGETVSVVNRCRA